MAYFRRFLRVGIAMPTLTQAALKQILRYDPDTGEFTWLVENMGSLQPIGPSGFRGVTIKRRLSKPYVAQITINKTRAHLGCFATGEEAHAAYLAAAAKHLPRLRGTVAGSPTAEGYWRIHIGYREYKAHHLACLYMTGALPSGRLDHRDLDKPNNRWENIRPATPSQNAANTRKAARNVAGLKGVSTTHRNLAKPYLALITVRGKCLYLGYFATAEEAHAAYMAAAEQHFGEFARAS